MAVKVKSINLASLSISVVTFILTYAILIVIDTALGYIMPAFIALILAFVTYAVSHFMIRKFVIYRIKPIYQMMLERNMSMGELETRFAGTDVVSDVSDELASWAEKKSAEIYRLKEMETYRKEFLGNVSHELKTPLFTLQGYILTLLDGGLNDPGINVRYLEKANKNVERLIAIVKDLEDISKLEMKIMNLNREQFDIVALCKDIVDSLSEQAKAYQVTLKVTSELPIDVFADKVRIEQVMTNLLVNSIKYGKPGGMTKVKFVDMFDKVMVEVEDNGIGISKENLPRVFERFFRADKSRSREEGGTGLGLAIVKHIIEAHKEKINVRSELGKGTVFSFTLNKYL